MSDFQRIKQAIEKEKQKRIQAETKIETLRTEAGKLMDEVEQLLGKRPKNVEELTRWLENLKTEIESEIKTLKDILEKEGVSY